MREWALSINSEELFLTKVLKYKTSYNFLKGEYEISNTTSLSFVDPITTRTDYPK